MNKKIFKTLIVFLGMLISSLLTPIIGQTYILHQTVDESKRSALIAAVTLFNVWEN
jgi:hypothetical protein